MGVTKTQLFSEDLATLANMAKALGHPARLAIIEHLVNLDVCVCGDLVNEIGLAQATISQHLKALKEVGLIKGQIEGTSVCYCLDTEAWTELVDRFTDLFNSVNSKSNSCC